MYKYLGNTGIKMYDILNFVSIIALVIMNMSALKQKKEFMSRAALRFSRRYYKKKNIKPPFNYTVFAIAELFFISLLQYGFVGIFTQKFGAMVHTGNNYFSVLYFVPFILMFFFYLIGISPLKQMDMITPAYPLALVFVKIACFCSGCCNGIEHESGLYNADTGLVEIPVQLAESALALIIFLILICLRKKFKEGTQLPIFIISYSGARFFLEFLRADENVLWFLKTYQILCIIGVILGVAELIIVTKYADKIKEFYNRRKIYY